MALGDRDLVTRLLKQSILTLCREAVAYNSRLEVDGIICLTADDQNQHVVKIHEFFDRAKETKTECPPMRNSHRNSHTELIYTARSPSSGHNSVRNSHSETIFTSRSPSSEQNSVRNSHSETIYTSRSPSSEQNPVRRRIICYATPEPEKETSNRSHLESETMVIKTEPDMDTDSYPEVKHEEEAVQNDSPLEIKPNKQSSSDLTSIDYAGLGVNKLTMSSARNILCKKCNNTLENVEVFQAHNMASHNHFTCLVCLATFTSRNNMKRHIRLHTGIKPYSCHKCPESFSRNDDFKRHLLKHTFHKPFRCAVCKTGYSDRSCVKSHMLKEHNSKVFHVCAQCGESYIDIMKFQQHKKCHTELQDYRCSICSFTGSNALMYNKHMLTHGPLKEYRCTHCDLSYSDPFMYTSHLKKHKGDELVQSYICCFCDMSLASFEQFQRHEHTHIHSKQHVCEVCDKVFRYPSNLREHMLTHLPKSSFQKNTRDNFEFRLHRDRDIPFPTMTNDNTFTNGDHDMQTEENNNKVDEHREQAVENDHHDDDDKNAMDNDDTSGCSDYWCTECSHGFGTESELQNHIINKHERKEDEIKDYNEDTDESRKYQDTKEMTDAFEVSTQMDMHSDGIYNENTQQDHSQYDENADNSTVIKERQSLSEYAKFKSNVPSIFRSKQTHRIYDEDTLVENSECHTGTLNNANASVVTHAPDVKTEIELNTVTDAMRQVKNIQSRFGIKSAEHDTLRERESDEFTKRLALGELNTECKRSWPHQLDSVNNASEQIDKKPEMPISVSISGMKMKFQRASYISYGPNDVETYNNSKDIWNNECGQPSMTREEISEPKVLNTFEESSPYSKSSVLGMNTEFSITPNRSSATTLNLKIRNPGFERVVTPDVLFKTKAPFTCEVCEETFGNYDDFHEHGVKVHRRFICSYCGKVFTSRPNRERHIRYHTGEKPYKCELCSATFLRGDDLKYHRTTKHADIKPFTCGACQTSFSLPKDLEKHLKIHPDHRL